MLIPESRSVSSTALALRHYNIVSLCKIKYLIIADFPKAAPLVSRLALRLALLDASLHSI